MITLKDYPKKETSSYFLFKKTLILSLFLWICQNCNNEGTSSKTLGTGHSIDTLLDLRYNRLLARHELISTVDEENIKEQLGYNTQRKSVYLKSGNKLENEAAKRGKVKSGNSPKSENVKGLNLKFGGELKREEGKNGNLKIKSELKKEEEKNGNLKIKSELKKEEEKNGNLKIKSELKSGSKIKKEEKEKNKGKKSDNESTEEVEAKSDGQRSEHELTEEEAEEEVEAESDAQRSEHELTEAETECDDGIDDNEMTEEVEGEADDQNGDDSLTVEEVEEVEGENDDETGEDDLIYEVNEENDDEECECEEPKNSVLNVEVFLEKKEEKKGKVKIELTLEKVLEDEDELLYNDDYFIRKEGIDYFDGEGDGAELGDLEQYFTLDFDDDLKLDQDEKEDKNRKSTYTREKRENQFILVLKEFRKLLALLNIIGLVIGTVTRKLDQLVEKLMFKAYARVDEYKKDPTISKNKFKLINFTYKSFFFIIPIMVFIVGIVVTQVVSGAGAYGSGIFISMGISFFIRNIKRAIKYQFKRQGIEKPGIEDYINLLEKFLMKFEKQEENPEGENADGEKSDGEKSEGEKSEGEKSEGEKSEGEKSEGDKSEGDKSEGDKSEEKKSEGGKSEEKKSEGEKFEEKKFEEKKSEEKKKK
ncbi:Plasmodium exported protein, unknown function [Plasmodium vivax]|nr:Plasmodium exported protein, unknown function [Plasmodium vivax]